MSGCVHVSGEGWVSGCVNGYFHLGFSRNEEICKGL